METFCVRHWVQILILFENSLSFRILCFSLALSSQHSVLKVIAKIKNLGLMSWLSVCIVGRASQGGGGGNFHPKISICSPKNFS